MAIQKQASLRDFIPVETEAKIQSYAITPAYCDPVVNLQMDWLLQKKSLLTKHLFQSYKTILFILSLTTTFAAYELRNWVSWYNWKHLSALFKGYGIYMSLLNCFIFFFASFSGTYLGLSNMTNSFKHQSEDVPENSAEYFGVDLKEYAKLDDGNKKTMKSNEMVKKMNGNSYMVVYREVPVAFIVLQEEKEEEQKEEQKKMKITGLGIRRVYMSAGLLEDLIQWAKDKAIREKFIVSMQVESFEKKVIQDLKKTGFKLTNTVEYNNTLLRNVYDIKSYTYTFSP